MQPSRYIEREGKLVEEEKDHYIEAKRTKENSYTEFQATEQEAGRFQGESGREGC